MRRRAGREGEEDAEPGATVTRQGQRRAFPRILPLSLSLYRARGPVGFVCPAPQSEPQQSKEKKKLLLPATALGLPL
jgi:hypothetical protein